MYKAFRSWTQRFLRRTLQLVDSLEELKITEEGGVE